MKVSVVVPAFNRESTIISCLDSIVNQTYKPYEIIVVDDGSTDKTVSLVESYSKYDIRLIKSQANRGAQSARNQGIKAARGDWIAFNDSDDIWLPEKLEMQRDVLISSGKYVCAGGGIKNEDGEKTKIGLGDKNIVDYVDVLSLDSYIMYQTLLVNKEVFKKIGLLDESIAAYQELDTAIKIAQYYDIVYLNVPLFIYMLHDGETISKNRKKGLEGIRYLFNKYSQDIIRITGKHGLGAWYEKIAANYGKGNWKYYMYCLKSVMCRLYEEKRR